MTNKTPIGIFDSGYGGLTVFRSIAQLMPQYDYLYLGDNARAPYGNRSFDTVHEYTWQAVQWFFAQGCPLVILACNTASAKALRTIQMQDLPLLANNNRVLGVIRPTAQLIGSFSSSQAVGVMGTTGTVASMSYPKEIAHSYPNIRVSQQACPMLVPLIENGEQDSEAAAYFIQKYTQELLAKDPLIDTILLACTHYPLIAHHIAQHLPAGVQVISQGDIVANSLQDYLQRHVPMQQGISRGGSQQFFTTDDTSNFDTHGSQFFGAAIQSSFADVLP